MQLAECRSWGRKDNKYTCRCGAGADEFGHHGLVCRLGGGRQLRHSALNDYICRLFSKASIPVLKEPSGISAHDGRRPDGCTLIPWRAGRCLAWDVTVPGTLAKRYVNLTSKECGLAAARAADEKMKKYGNALPSMEFLPICIEVLGPMNPNTLKFLKEICKMISAEITLGPMKLAFKYYKLNQMLRHKNN
ncbi:hypothetical protein HELRODRAFT_182398 [Helobdella robusta]|uniref:Uncharacterized protein n=1 Tax=Helobdella robusta TaxID=6412 RepID=T1FI50_HELRO|nr:hypothetical protein HELRODRAFT_182398 [Helobdella robusta]ESN90932.1 hypothetical protein HELRODRAFT_182398 [Helobdella robusta]